MYRQAGFQSKLTPNVPRPCLISIQFNSIRILRAGSSSMPQPLVPGLLILVFQRVYSARMPFEFGDRAIVKHPPCVTAGAVARVCIAQPNSPPGKAEKIDGAQAPGPQMHNESGRQGKGTKGMCDGWMCALGTAMDGKTNCQPHILV